MQRISFLLIPLALIGGLHLLTLSSCVHEPFFPEPLDTIPTDTIPVDTIPVDTIPVDTISVVCAPDTIYFEQDIFPLMQKHYCAACHIPANNIDGISLNNYANIVNSNVIDLENPTQSSLYTSLLETDPAKVMPPPPYDPMQPYEIEMIRLWIAQGALDNSCDQSIACDTTGLTYTARIRPLLEANCIGCHTAGNRPGGDVVLSTYTDVAAVARSGKLYGAVARHEGYEPMPKGLDPLSDCDIYLIKAWVARDYPE